MSGWLRFIPCITTGVHKSIRVTPAMQAGLSAQVFTFEDLARLIEAATSKTGKHGPYKKVAKISN